MTVSKEFQEFLESEPDVKETEDYLPKLPRLGVDDDTEVRAIRGGDFDKMLRSEVGLTVPQQAAVVRMLGELGTVAIGTEEVWADWRTTTLNVLHHPTVGEVRAIPDTELVKIPGVGPKTVAVSRALFGRAEEKDRA